jgi:hypothetical protein
MTLSKPKIKCDIQHYDTQHNMEHNYAQYNLCCVFFILSAIMLNVYMLRVVMLNVVAPRQRI